MTKKNSPSNEIENAYGNDINISRLLEPIIRHWKLIPICAFGLGIFTFAIASLLNFMQPAYRSVVLVASTTSSSSINFKSSIPSLTDIQSSILSLADLQSSDTTGNIRYDWGLTRLQSFVSQVQNGAIAEQVLQELGPIYDRKGKIITAARLLGVVRGELIKNTDTIRISVKYEDPVITSKIANAWGKEYVQRINEIYSSSGTTSRATEVELEEAKKGYKTAEEALEIFISKDKTAEYRRMIDDYSSIIPLGRQVGLFIDTAVSMRNAVKTGGEAAAISNSLALTMLKTQIYSAFQGTNTLQIQNLPEALGSSIATVDAAGMVADLDSLIATLGTSLDTLEKRTLENEEKIRELTSLITAQTSTLSELTETRDRAWKAYNSLATKASEMSLSAQNTQVVLASTATPSVWAGISVPKYTIIALGAGFLMSIIIIFTNELGHKYKD